MTWLALLGRGVFDAGEQPVGFSGCHMQGPAVVLAQNTCQGETNARVLAGVVFAGWIAPECTQGTRHVRRRYPWAFIGNAQTPSIVALRPGDLDAAFPVTQRVVDEVGRYSQQSGRVQG